MEMHKFSFPLLPALALATGAEPAFAAEPASAGGSVSLSPAGASGDASATGPEAAPAAEPAPAADANVDAKADAKAKKNKGGSDEPWIKRYRPTRNQIELGIFGGLMFPAGGSHELYNPNLTWAPYKKVAPDIGLRVGFYPLSFLGLEIEGAVVPTKINDATGGGAFLGGFRGYGLFQLPYRIAPFALIGIGFLGAQSDRLGKDIDPAIHFGGGVKFYVNRLIALRLDIRDNVSAQHLVDNGRTHYPEILLGLSILLNRKKPEPKKDRDTDGDGYLDSVDHCVNEPGVAPHGCPAAPPPADDPDRDGDGFVDRLDDCPDNPGTAPDGCPDTDGDGFKDNKDKCPTVPGVAPDGCPPPDTDKDGIIDDKDSCINEPETKNGYKDVDGCPDEVPKAVTKFQGVIKGIFFDVNKDTIKKNSRPTLDNAVKVLKDFPEVKVEISGHTDSDGSRELNTDLSRRRAESVKKYLVDKGIDPQRLTTQGFGPDQPIADNATKKGKAQNRRIEFKLIGD
jgi:outer membrane protein OmpA-like peptidoglycan-associated protein